MTEEEKRNHSDGGNNDESGAPDPIEPPTTEEAPSSAVEDGDGAFAVEPPVSEDETDAPTPNSEPAAAADGSEPPNDDPPLGAASSSPEPDPSPRTESPSSQSSEESEQRQYSERSYQDKLDDTERGLRDELLQRVGDDKVQQLTSIYTRHNANEDSISPGLHVVFGHTTFGMAWASRRTTPGDTKCITVGTQQSKGKPHDLKSVVERYKSAQVLVVEVDKNAAQFGPFWQKNKDIAEIDRSAKQANLALVFLVPDEVRLDWRQESEQLEQLWGREVGIEPGPWKAVKTLLTEHARPDVEKLASEVTVQLEGEDLGTVFDAWCDDDFDTVMSILENDGTSKVVAEWNEMFRKVAVDGMNREPVAAAALFLGSNFPALPQHLFNEVWGILQSVLKAKWTEPVIKDERDFNPREWREAYDDEALIEINLKMRRSSGGRRKARFSSHRMAEHYAELISESAQSLDLLLTSSIFSFVRPLNLGEDVSKPAARLFVSQVRARYGDGASSSAIARELFEVIREHRREADEAISAFLHEHALLQHSEGSEVKAILLHAHALDKSRQAEELVFEAPSFIILVLREFFDEKAAERALDVVRHLWDIAKSEGHDEQTKADFWRQVVIGTVYGIDHEQAITVLGDLFDYDPDVFFTHGRGASAGLWLETLPEALRAAAQSYELQKERSEVWTFGAITGLVTFWMHWAAQIGRKTSSPIAAPATTEALSRVFLTKRGVWLLTHLSEITQELHTVASSRDREMDETRQSTLARSLLFQQLRMLYGVNGNEFEAIRKAVDGSGSKGRFADNERWLAPKPGEKKKFPEFDTWRRKHAACSGLAMIIGEVLIRDADPGERVLAACEAAPNPDVARQVVKNGLLFLDNDLAKVRRVLKTDQTRRDSFDHLGITLRKMYDALREK
ncbi:MAG: hypothetical protein QNJ09_04280 [Paracoccaceae bacterium]|nr:hypothetical protein [Paracoccaceae bacterium]